MATGASTDPYIVSSWEEFIENYNNASFIGSYVKFKNDRRTKYDLAKTYPSGVSGGLVIYPHILGNGATWKNLYTYGGQFGINFIGKVDDLKVEALYVKDAQQIFKFDGGEITSLVASAEITTSAELYVINKGVNTNTTFSNCQMDLKCICREGASRTVYFIGGGENATITMNNCEVKLDWKGFYSVQFITPTIMNACLFNGYVQADGDMVRFYDFKQGTTADYPDSLVDIVFDTDSVFYGSYTSDTSATVFYNSSKTPPFAEGSLLNAWVGITSEQIASETALNNAGFHTGGDSPWVYVNNYIEQDDWKAISMLGAFNNLVEFAHCNSYYEGRKCVLPMSVKSVGRYAFQIQHLAKAALPSDCTYYATSFGNVPVSGGILIE